MNRRHPLALVGAGSVLLAAVPLSSLFASLTWMLYSAIAVGFIVGSAMLTRHLRGPVWAQVLVMMAALLFFLTIAFPSGNEFLRLIPTASTFQHFNDLLVTAGQQIRTQAVPVPDLDALLLLTTLGVGLVAVLVDLAAVGLRRPALAGLPMLAMYSVPVAILPDGVPVVTFLFAAAGYMWLLVTDSVDRVRRFGRRFTGEGRDVDIWEPSPLAAAGRRLGLVGLVVAIVLPLSLPGLSSGLLDVLRNSNSGTGPGNGNGTGTTVDLSGYLTDQLLSRDNTLNMVQVSTTDPSPYYLRFGVADEIKDNGFVARAPNGSGLDTIPQPGTPDVPGVTSAHYEATVKVLPDFTMNLAPAYQQLISVDEGLDGNWFYDPNSSLIFSHGTPVAKNEYTMQFSRISYTPAALRLAPAVPSDFRPLAQVPTVPQISDLVARLTAGDTTEYDRIISIFDYFTDPSNNFIYSVVAPVSKPGDSPIVDFLAAKKGFCVQYAAAMAWLARAAGYPARMAFGFTRGQGPNQQNVTTLTNQNLHAWTEVYFPEFGWVPFDATPSFGVVGSVQTAWAHDPTQPISPGPTTQPSGTVGPAPSPDTLHGGSSHGASGGSAPTSQVLTNPWLLGGIGLLAALIALAVTPAMRRRALTRRRRAQSGETIELDLDAAGSRPPGSVAGDLVTDRTGVAAARRDAHAAWAELHDTMIDFGVDVDEAETPRVTADRVGALLGDARSRELTRLLGRAEERARYAPLPLRADGLNEAVQTVRTGLAQRATRWERFTAIVMPRSVLLRWRLAFITRVANIVAASARARAALGAASPRRALSRASTR
jgi:transglutaminase-like putative cysteine protease